VPPFTPPGNSLKTKIHPKKIHDMKNKMSLIKALALFLFACAVARAEVYDDFSSGGLDKWHVESVQWNGYTVEDNLLVLHPIAPASHGWPWSRYTSVQADFPIDPINAPLQVQVNVPEGAFLASSTSDYSSFEFGFKDDDGRTLAARISWIALEGRSWRVAIFYNDEMVGHHWVPSGGLPEPSEGDAYVLFWDGETASLEHRSVSGAKKGSFAVTKFAGPLGPQGAIYFRYQVPPGSDEEGNFFKMRSIGSGYTN
jgi:hypothetical protein